MRAGGVPTRALGGIPLRCGGSIAWGEAAPVAHDLRAGCVELTGRASSGPRRWAYASLSPDLARVAYWETFGDRQTGAPARVVVRGVDDGAVALRHETAAQFIGAALVFHPTRPLLAFLDDSRLITVLDFEAGRALVERGPQAHSASFGPGETPLRVGPRPRGGLTGARRRVAKP